MSDALVDLDVEGGVATVTFSRPEHDNMVSWAMLQQCEAALADAGDSTAEVLLLRGEGAHFSLGRDQNEDLADVPREEIIGTIMSANEAVAEFPGAAIALVQGKALGFACGIATQCDLTVAADTAEFGFNEIEHGFAPKIVLSYLETYVGRKDAVDLVMTGRNVPAEEARRMGLVSRVVASAQLEDYGRSLADSLLELDNDALIGVKTFLPAVEDVPLEERQSFVLDAML